MSKLSLGHLWRLMTQRSRDPDAIGDLVRNVEAVQCRMEQALLELKVGFGTNLDEVKNRFDEIDAKFDRMRLQQNFDSLHNRSDEIDRKLDRMWLHIDLIRTHAAVYVGDGMSLTWLPDQMPILVNIPDFHGPLNLINGGRYEERNIDALLSFMDDNTLTFVDVGANVGYFTIRLAERFRQRGRVLAFEPHPKLAKMTEQNASLNGFTSVVTVYPFALADFEGERDFSFERGHMGSGVMESNDDTERFEVIQAHVRKLDDVLDADATVDLIKIDVEGHELGVMRGMRQIIARSPHLKILFEKIGTHVGQEADIEALLYPFGFQLYEVLSDSQLAPLAPGELATITGYALAARPEQVDSLDRRRFNIYPSQLNLPDRPPLRPGEVLVAEEPRRQTLFYGPYWYLRRGRWRLTIHGKIEGEIRLSVAEHRGFVTNTQIMSATQMEFEFANLLDLSQFEIVARPIKQDARVEIERLELVYLP